MRQHETTHVAVNRTAVVGRTFDMNRCFVRQVNVVRRYLEQQRQHRPIDESTLRAGITTITVTIAVPDNDKSHFTGTTKNIRKSGAWKDES